MNSHEVLVKARNLIADEKDWCQNSEACDADGDALEFATEPNAVSFCAAGAMYRALGYRPDHETVMQPLFREVLRAAGGLTREDDWFIGPFNDTHSHAEVLAAFDKAITATAPQPDTSFLAEIEQAIPA